MGLPLVFTLTQTASSLQTESTRAFLHTGLDQREFCVNRVGLGVDKGI